MELYIVGETGREAVDGDLNCYYRIGDGGRWYRAFGIRATMILTRYMKNFPEKGLTPDRIRELVSVQMNERLARYGGQTQEEVTGCGLRWWESPSSFQ